MMVIIDGTPAENVYTYSELISNEDLFKKAKLIIDFRLRQKANAANGTCKLSGSCPTCGSGVYGYHGDPGRYKLCPACGRHNKDEHRMRFAKWMINRHKDLDQDVFEMCWKYAKKMAAYP